jgi:hypothetical protein
LAGNARPSLRRFLLLGIGQIILGLGGMPDEQRSLVYLVRFTAFLLIIRAVVAKNRAT